jgi:hypothetical protein
MPSVRLIKHEAVPNAQTMKSDFRVAARRGSLIRTTHQGAGCGPTSSAARLLAKALRFLRAMRFGGSLFLVGSTDRRNTFCELLSWSLIEQGFSRPFIELPRDRAELGLAIQ